MSSSLGVVVVHYHREAELARLLDELTGVHGLDPAVVVVVDNGSDAEEIDAVRRAHRGTWLSLDNPGYGAAVNAGVAALPAVEHVAVLTHEAVLEGGALAALSSVLTSRSDVGLVGPVLRDSRDGTIWSAGGITSRVRRLPRHLDAGAASVSSVGHDVEWLDGSCFLVRRAEFVELGGMDERFFLYFEDVDLGWRYRDHGLRVRVVPSAIAWQSPGGHLDQFYATRNVLWLFRKHRLRLACAAYALETVARLSVGTLLKPRGSRQRQFQRWRGFVQGLSNRSYSAS